MSRDLIVTENQARLTQRDDREMANSFGFTASLKRLREATGAGMLDCKNALVEAGGDFDRALQLLRVKGAKDKRRWEGRTAANGLVTALLEGTSAGVLVELRCETDFVAKTGPFQQVAADIAAAALKYKPADRGALLELGARPGLTAGQLIDEAAALVKENVKLGRFARFEGGYLASYLHRSDRALPPTLGVLVQLDSPNERAARDVARQIAAMRPLYVTRDEVPADVVISERSIAEQRTREEGKPEQAIGKIVEDRLSGFFSEVVLTEQPFVVEQEQKTKKTVMQVLSEQGVAVRAFARFGVGEAS